MRNKGTAHNKSYKQHFSFRIFSMHVVGLASCKRCQLEMNSPQELDPSVLLCVLCVCLKDTLYGSQANVKHFKRAVAESISFVKKKMHFFCHRTTCILVGVPEKKCSNSMFSICSSLSLIALTK